MVTPHHTISDRPPFISLVGILWLVFVGFVIVGPQLGEMITMSYYSGDVLQDINSGEYKAGLATALLIVQATTTFVGLIFFPIIYITYVEHKSVRALFPKQPDLVTMLIITAIIGITSPVSLSPVLEWNLNLSFPEFMSGFEEWARGEERRISKRNFVMDEINSPAEMFTALLVVAFLAAIGEELVFRGMIQRELWRGSGNIHVAIWSSALIFSIVHMQFYGLLPRLLLGALFGYLYYWSGNLLISVTAHFFNNAFIVVMTYLHNIKLTNFDITDGGVMPWHLVPVCLVISFVLVFYSRKHYHKYITNNA